MLINCVAEYIYITNNVGITKIYLYNFEPMKPHFYIVKLAFTGINIFFLISAKKTYIVGEAVLTSTYNLSF